MLFLTPLKSVRTKSKEMVFRPLVEPFGKIDY